MVEEVGQQLKKFWNMEDGNSFFKRLTLESSVSRRRPSLSGNRPTVMPEFSTKFFRTKPLAQLVAHEFDSVTGPNEICHHLLASR